MVQKFRRLKIKVLIVLGLFVVVPLAGLVIFKMESHGAKIGTDLNVPAIGKTRLLTISTTDTQSGLRKIQVSLNQNQAETILLEKNFDSAGILEGGKVKAQQLKTLIEPKKLGLKEGKALLTINVWDYSWRHFMGGNLTSLNKEIDIDTVTPQIYAVSKVHNITQGGTGLVVYKLSEKCPHHGVRVGDRFYKGYSCENIMDTETNDYYMTFFGLNHDQGPGTQIVLEAADFAGNTVQSGFPHHIRKASFRTDTINISDRFLQYKMPEFDNDIPDDIDKSGISRFLYVNRKLRQLNYGQITSYGADSDNRIHWSGKFMRLPQSARMASYADHREYRYGNEKIDDQTHLGIDLASTAQSKIPAANSGKVVFIGSIGIYGNTVIIDHGFGLFSTYSHLTRIDVKDGQPVTKGETIGTTGTTGLAGGDHLHYGIMVHQTFVNPIEWWDGDWIRKNITSKLGFTKLAQKK